MTFSKSIIYVDESGDHGLASIDPEYPVFVLVFCIFEKSAYSAIASRDLHDFKFRWFGHDGLILHERDIVKKKPPFGFLQFDAKRTAFLDDLTDVIRQMPLTIIASVIRKDMLSRRYSTPENPYKLALLFCMEKAQEFLQSQGDRGVCHILCESRSPREKAGSGKEDKDLALEFLRIREGRHFLQTRPLNMHDFRITFLSKAANSAGLQIADLVARPIGLKSLRPDQPNRAYDVIQAKIWSGPAGDKPAYGIKPFP